MSEYYVTHSKYKRNNAWENCLTYKKDIIKITNFKLYYR